MNEQIEQIRDKAIPVFLEFNVSKASIFGSYARGDFTEKSDIDLLIDFEKPVTLVEFFRFKNSLKEILECDVDVVSNRAILSPFKNYILDESIQIYDKR